MATDKTASDNAPSLSESVALRLRQQITLGQLRPGQRLSEAQLSEKLAVSRNTLREAFRMLTLERLLEYRPNRGVFVSTPDMMRIIDIYRVRKMIECQSVASAWPGHPAVRLMRQAVEEALICGEKQDWDGVGSANMAFHRAIVELADSQRLSDFYRHILAELRLAFGLLNDAEHLHFPFIGMNNTLLSLVEAGQVAEAARMLQEYLDRSERVLLASFARRDGDG
ncbi:GntR family transcriptional regulator [Erwinia papayae]|uniref:GntR family transcriptional regulator n=1 Tax=Erwinia papayae TaxID=206499 RepID=A0ABV3N1V8_9GAMM